MTHTEALKLALEALEQWNTPLYKRNSIINAIKEALAQPQQEPVAWQKIECPICGDMAVATDIPPPQRKPLTDEEIESLRLATGYAAGLERFTAIAQAIEAKLKAKNEH